MTGLPTQVGLLTALEEIKSPGAKGFTTLPSEIGRLTALTLLDTQNGGFTSLPSELALLRNADNLLFSQNQLTGTLPTQLANMREMRLNVQQNMLMGNAPVFDDSVTCVLSLSVASELNCIENCPLHCTCERPADHDCDMIMSSTKEPTTTTTTTVSTFAQTISTLSSVRFSTTLTATSIIAQPNAEPNPSTDSFTIAIVFTVVGVVICVCVSIAVVRYRRRTLQAHDSVYNPHGMSSSSSSPYAREENIDDITSRDVDSYRANVNDDVATVAHKEPRVVYAKLNVLSDTRERYDTVPPQPYDTVPTRDIHCELCVCSRLAVQLTLCRQCRKCGRL